MLSLDSRGIVAVKSFAVARVALAEFRYSVFFIYPFARFCC